MLYFFIFMFSPLRLFGRGKGVAYTRGGVQLTMQKRGSYQFDMLHSFHVIVINSAV